MTAHNKTKAKKPGAKRVQKSNGHKLTNQSTEGVAIMSTDTRKSVADFITETIIEKLEAGCVPWRKPWNGSANFPRNLISKKAYRGINAFILGSGFASPWFATFRQIQEKGGIIKKGAKSIPVVFWSIKEVEDWETGSEKKIPLLRYYRVFNASDVDCIDIPTIEETTREFTAIEEAQRIVNSMPQRPDIKTGEARAYYSPTLDYVNMPRNELFHSDEEYYSTIFHELTHSTGHGSRLNRTSVTKSAYYGSGDYSKEELVAEMGASFLNAEAGIMTATIDNSAAYIKGWIAALKSKDNRGLVIQAAAAAQKAADFILNRGTSDTNLEQV
jgi:antirestriction protein ArdC